MHYTGHVETIESLKKIGQKPPTTFLIRVTEEKDSIVFRILVAKKHLQFYPLTIFAGYYLFYYFIFKFK